MLTTVTPSEARDARSATPKHLAKRAQIIEAARQILARDGLQACTARAVADASPLTKSAIHYYFADMDEIIDAAMAAHLTAFLDTVRAAADRHADAVDRFWAAMQAYVETFEEQPNAARLWFAYWLDSAQRSRTRPLDDMHREVTALLAELLANITAEDPQARAHALLSYLLGTVVQQAVQPLSFPVLATEIARLCGIEPAE